MFDKKSDYALNKLDSDAIVCKSATGVHIRLTCADFTSDEEFLRWKNWSDGDYRDTEKSGRSFYDRCVSLDTCMNQMCELPSIEAELFTALNDKAAKGKQAHEITEWVKLLKSWLTKTQYRRLWMLHAEGLSIEEIAAREDVSFQTVYECLTNARRRIVNNLKTNPNKL